MNNLPRRGSTLRSFACFFITTSNVFTEKFLDDCNYNDYNIGIRAFEAYRGLWCLRSLFYKWPGLIK